MKVRWFEGHTWEAVKGFDVISGEPFIDKVRFNAGDEVEVKAVQRSGEFRTSTITFPDGTILYGVPNGVFAVIG